MAKKTRRVSRRGVLTRLLQVPLSRKAPPTLLRKVLSWAGQALIGVALVALIVLVLFAMFRPTLGERALEGDFKIVEIQDGAAAGSFPPEQMAVAAAVVQIQRQRVLLPVTAEQRRGLEPGREVHVRFVYFPRLSRVRVDSWSPK